MATIYKFPLDAIHRQRVFIPQGATPLHLGLDPSSDICLWMKVPKVHVPEVERVVYCIGTGREIPDAPLTHIGSVCRGPFVWHFFMLDIIGDQPQ
jgi:hypothetical protein